MLPFLTLKNDTNIYLHQKPIHIEMHREHLFQYFASFLNLNVKKYNNLYNVTETLILQ